MRRSQGTAGAARDLLLSIARLPPATLESVVAAALARIELPSPARLCVALSGGADSMALLEIVHRLRSILPIELQALHVQHGLSPHAETWVQFCQQACADRAVPLQVHRVSVRRTPGESLEETARELRYACFAQTEADVLLLAHHLDDQCETLLLRLLRGSGLHGLLGMPASRLLPAEPASARIGKAPLLLRPLLEVTRAQLREYAAQRDLRWIVDESNADEALTRNYLRAQVLPSIEVRFPAYRQAMGRALAGLGDAAAILDERASQDLQSATVAGTLRVEQLAAIGTARALNVLRTYLASQGCRPPARAHLLESWRQLRDATPDAGVRVRIGDGTLARYRNGVHWVRELPARDMAQVYVWLGGDCLPLGAGQGKLRLREARGEGIRAALMCPGDVHACTAVGSMRLTLQAGRPSRTLKNLFQEAAIPPWVRRASPALRAGGNTLWVAGLGYDCRHGAAPGEPGWCVEWVSDLSAPQA